MPQILWSLDLEHKPKLQYQLLASTESQMEHRLVPFSTDEAIME